MERTAVVSGGSGGLGAVVTATLLADGWRVVVPYVEERELERLESSPRLHTLAADLFDPAPASSMRGSDALHRR